MATGVHWLDMLGGFFGGDPASAAAGGAGGIDAVFGKKPKVAPYTPTNLSDEQWESIRSNAAVLPEIKSLLDEMLPGFSDMIDQGSENTLSFLRGEIPPDVQAKIRRDAAFRSLSGGFAGSPMSRALTARDLGRTSLDMMMLGENSAQKWAGIASGAYSPFMITPTQQAEITMRNNLYEQATKQFKYNVKAAPDPGAAGLFNMNAAIGGQFLGLGMGFATGGMGGGGTGSAIGGAAVSSTQPRTYGGGI